MAKPSVPRLERMFCEKINETKKSTGTEESKQRAEGLVAGFSTKDVEALFAGLKDGKLIFRDGVSDSTIAEYLLEKLQNVILQEGVTKEEVANKIATLRAQVDFLNGLVVKIKETACSTIIWSSSGGFYEIEKERTYFNRDIMIRRVTEEMKKYPMFLSDTNIFDRADQSNESDEFLVGIFNQVEERIKSLLKKQNKDKEVAIGADLLEKIREDAGTVVESLTSKTPKD